MLISIVMGYLNRIEQLDFTLYTIGLSTFRNVEIIIVNDGSIVDQNPRNLIPKYPNLAIMVIDIDPIEKERQGIFNPCVAYNIAIDRAKGDVIIIQNPECCHIGDLCQYVSQNIAPNKYLVFPCANNPTINYNTLLKQIYKTLDDKNTVFDYTVLLEHITWQSKYFAGYCDPWYQHPVIRPCKYHFTTAIMRKDLIEKIGGGFNNDYAYGYGYDDNELIDEIERKKMNVVQLSPNSSPFVVHQWHPRPPLTADLNNKSVKNKQLYENNKHHFRNSFVKINYNSLIKGDIHGQISANVVKIDNQPSHQDIANSLQNFDITTFLQNPLLSSTSIATMDNLNKIIFNDNSYIIVDKVMNKMVEELYNINDEGYDKIYMPNSDIHWRLRASSNYGDFIKSKIFFIKPIYTKQYVYRYDEGDIQTIKIEPFCSMIVMYYVDVMGGYLKFNDVDIVPKNEQLYIINTGKDINSIKYNQKTGRGLCIIISFFE